MAECRHPYLNIKGDLVKCSNCPVYWRLIKDAVEVEGDVVHYQRKESGDEEPTR